MTLLDRRTKFCMAASALTMLALVILIAAAVRPAQAQTIAFPAPTTFIATYCNPYPCGNLAVAALTGDFNGDGKLDVLTLDGSYLNVILGKGDGTFQTPVSLNISATGIFSEAIAVGDFTSSHMLDVAVWAVNSNTGNSEIHVFLGNGTGSLTYNSTYAAPSSGNTNPGPNSIVAADVNGDGKLDLVAMTPYNGVFVFLGNGDGTFQGANCQHHGLHGRDWKLRLTGGRRSEWRRQARSRCPIQRYDGRRDDRSVEQRHRHIWDADILSRGDLWHLCLRRHRDW